MMGTWIRKRETSTHATWVQYYGMRSKKIVLIKKLQLLYYSYIAV